MFRRRSIRWSRLRIRSVFAQDNQAVASQTWRHVADQSRLLFPKLAALMGEAEADVLAFMAFPRTHWPQLHATNPTERSNKEVKRRADVVGIFPNEATIRRLVSAILFEQNNEWQLQHRNMSLETMTGLADEATPLPKVAVWRGPVHLRGGFAQRWATDS